jgi:hypothetical protein
MCKADERQFLKILQENELKKAGVSLSLFKIHSIFTVLN